MSNQIVNILVTYILHDRMYQVMIDDTTWDTVTYDFEETTSVNSNCILKMEIQPLILIDNGKVTKK